MPIYDKNGKILTSKKRPSNKELGGTGRSTSSYNQWTLDTDEYLPDLQYNEDISIYNKMGRSDGQVKAILLMMSLPIRATQWFVTPKDSSAKSKEIATFVEECLFGGYGIGLQTGFDAFIRDVTTMFQYGHSIFEKVFYINNGKIKWKKFAVRPQSTIYDIFYDRVGDCEGIEQYLVKQNWETIYIPIEKLLFFSHDMQQGNMRGTSVLRAAYKHWKIKDFLYKITNVGVERNAVGTPVLTLPEGYTEDDKDLADEIVTTLRSSEFGGVRMPDGFILDMFEGKRTLVDVQPYIDHQDELIARSILAQFMNLGSAGSGSGSFALSSDQSQMFLMMLDSAAKNIANIMNTHAIPELVNYNYASDLYPELSFKPMNNTKLINTLKTLIDGKLVLPDDDLEDYLREMLDLPEKNPVKSRKEMQEQFEQSQEMKSLVSGKEGDGKSKNPIDNVSKQASYKDKIKQDNVDKKLSEVYENSSDEFKDSLKNIISRQLLKLNENAYNKDINDYSSIKVQYKGELTKLFKSLNFDDGIKYDAKCSILSNNISEKVKSVFLSEFIDNTNIDLNEIANQIIKSI